MTQHDILHHKCIGALIDAVLTETYPLKVERIRLAKVIVLDRNDLFAQKSQLSQFEISGDNYLFWAYATLRKPQFRKKFHAFEQDRSKQRFLFGQLTVSGGQLLCDCREVDFFHWAKIAYIKKWFDVEDVKTVQISYFQSALGSLSQQLTFEKD